ncbi:MAG TPA: hypothetical protein VGD84_18160 [Pseudonocardiaceae bacterium]
MQALQTTGPALIMLFGGYLVVSGHTSVGTVFVFATVLGQRLAGAVSSLATLHVDITGSLALFGRLFAYIDRPPEIADTPDATDLGAVSGAVALAAVSFTRTSTPMSRSPGRWGLLAASTHLPNRVRVCPGIAMAADIVTGTATGPRRGTVVVRVPAGRRGRTR